MSEERVSLLEMLRERTKQYALRIIRLYGALPATTEAGVIGRQLLRSGTSVGANYREAYRARSNNEYVAKLGLCLQELDESAYWLELLADAGICFCCQKQASSPQTNSLPSKTKPTNSSPSSPPSLRRKV